MCNFEYGDKRYKAYQRELYLIHRQLNYMPTRYPDPVVFALINRQVLVDVMVAEKQIKRRVDSK